MLNTLKDNLSAMKESFELSSSSTSASCFALSLRFLHIRVLYSRHCYALCVTCYLNHKAIRLRTFSLSLSFSLLLDNDQENISCVFFSTFIPHIAWPNELMFVFTRNKMLLILFYSFVNVYYANEIYARDRIIINVKKRIPNSMWPP